MSGKFELDISQNSPIVEKSTSDNKIGGGKGIQNRTTSRDEHSNNYLPAGGMLDLSGMPMVQNTMDALRMSLDSKGNPKLILYTYR